MSRLVLYMSMSLDGFITGPEDDKTNSLGVDGHRLHDWLRDGDVDPGSHRPSAEPSRTVFDEMLATGAVVTGKRTGELVDYWGGDHHDGVPIFVPTHRAPGGEPPGHVRFITDGIESCVAQAKAAAGVRDDMLHGANTAQECLRAGVLDELEIHLSRSCLARAAGCSAGSAPGTSSSTWSALSRHPACCTCATE
jgi:dihydrofolate reductase